MGYNDIGSGYSTEDGLQATTHYIPIPDHAQYKYVIDIQGVGYSSRLKLLMQLKRPVFIVERDYHEFFFPFMVPFKHYIPVKRNLSDLIPLIKWLNEDEESYKMIVHETNRFAEKYLSKEYAIKHLYQTIAKYGLD
ncbi:glycosyl transferase family 90 [Alkalihalobacillus sp. TS-13]|uniref:glycosyl transferase family 90 n=1 Tax=Alkalihalobacillus sp. TS-13 TaxID=2842455 RepID=UPI001C86E16A|nr:glycosyl transferase family 90 [Alkalihalobacillus sp. TS-13]